MKVVESESKHNDNGCVSDCRTGRAAAREREGKGFVRMQTIGKGNGGEGEGRDDRAGRGNGEGGRGEGQSIPSEQIDRHEMEGPLALRSSCLPARSPAFLLAFPAP